MTRGRGPCSPDSLELPFVVAVCGSGAAQERSTLRQRSFASSSCDFAFHLQTTAHASSALPASVTSAMMGGPVCTCYFFHLASERYFGPAPCTVSSLFMEWLYSTRCLRGAGEAGCWCSLGAPFLLYRGV